MSKVKSNHGMRLWRWAICPSLLVTIALVFFSFSQVEAQGTANSPPSFDTFKTTLTVDENQPTGQAIGNPIAATDADGDSLHFALFNGHSDMFSIDSGTGQLRTKAVLDYETKPEDDYWVHVGVRDGKGPDGTRDLVADDSALVVIEVVNVDEPGTVSLDWRKPWMAGQLQASLTDVDSNISNSSWQWARSASRNGQYVDITGATASTYTPVAADDGKYLQVEVNYTDGHGSGKTAQFAFTHPVGSVAGVGSPLVFSEGDSTTRSVNENSPTGTRVGSAIRATGGSGLLYTLGGSDASSFTIDSGTGQLRTKTPLDYETTPQAGYSVTVQVTNVSGGSDSISVTINVADEPVEIHGPTRIQFPEDQYPYSSVVHNFTIVPASTILTLSGPDARFFTISGQSGTGSYGVLNFNEEPDYEAPLDSGRNNVYDITINAVHGSDRKTQTLSVEVKNHNEAPVITGPESVEFTEQTTAAVASYTARDPENDPIRWAVQDTDDWALFQISQSGVLTFRDPPDYETRDKDVYEVVILAQSGMNMATDGSRVQVTVTDGADPPLFDQGYSQTRSISEGATRDTLIGQPVSATGGPSATMSYSLRGTHAGSFALDSTTGQLKTKVNLNYETRNSYSVRIRASDGALASEAAVTINVVNEDEAGSVSLSPAQPRARIPLSASLTDPDGGVTGTTWLWEISSDGNSWSTISGAASETFTPSDDDVGKYLRAAATYADGHGSGKNAYGQFPGTVQTGPNRSPSFSSQRQNGNTQNGVTTFEVAENTAAGTDIGAPVTATDLDGDSLTYALAGGDAASFSIVANSGQLRTKASLDYERKNRYTLMVRARDPSNAAANMTVNVSVTNVEEPGSITLSPSQPRVGALVTANLRDPDGTLSGISWQWKSADSATGTGEAISGATSNSLLPAAALQGKYLWASATYTDIHGSGNSAQSAPVLVGAAQVPRTSRSSTRSPSDDSASNSAQPPSGNPAPSTSRTASVAYGSSNYLVDEGGQVQITARLATPTDQDLRIPVTISANSAESGDYRVSGLSNGRLYFGQGSRAASFTVVANHDSDSDDETLTLAFGALPGGITSGPIPRATLTIVDDDPPPVSLSYGSAIYLVNEGEQVRVTARLATAASHSIRVPVSVARGTAESGDYRISGLPNGSLYFSRGSRAASFTIVANHDSDVHDETLTLAFGALPGGVTAGSIPSATLTIDDDESATTRPPSSPSGDDDPVSTSLAYGSSNYIVNEGGQVQITARLATPTNRVLRIPVSINGNSAESGDYRVSGLSSGSLYFSSGSRSASFIVVAHQDNDTDDESLSLAFGALPDGITNGPIPRATLTIIDDDTAQVSHSYSSSSYRVDEGSQVRVTARLATTASHALRVPVSIDRGTAESGDYRISGLSNGSLHFSRGSRAASFIVIAQRDDDPHDETLTLAFGSLPVGVTTGKIPSATLTINDAEATLPLQLNVYYRSAEYAVSEGQSISVTVGLSARSDKEVRVPITATNQTAEDGDYAASGLTDGALYFAPGILSRSFTFTAHQDEDADDERLTLGFGALTRGVTAGSVPRASLTIDDDEVPPPSQPSVSFTSAKYAVPEGQSVSVTARLSAGSDRELRLPITATNQTAEDGDYLLSGLTNGALHFAPGVLTQSFTFTAAQDDDADNEQVSLAFGTMPANTVSGSGPAAIVTIEDDDSMSQSIESKNEAPVFTEGEQALRRIGEQSSRGTSVGLPVTAVDPDGDLLTYNLNGADASYFSIDSRTGQLRVWSRLDLEVKRNYLATLSVSDGRGGTDFIEVSISLYDIQEVPVTSPSTQSVGLMSPGVALSLETPDGSGGIRLPADFHDSPLFVLVESGAVDCVGRWPDGDDQAYLTVQVFDTWGSPLHELNMEKAVASLRFDASDLGDGNAAHTYYREDSIKVYRYGQQEGSWRPNDFSFEVDELGVVELALNGTTELTCLSVVTLPLVPTHTMLVAAQPPEPDEGKTTASPIVHRGPHQEPTKTPTPGLAIPDSGASPDGQDEGGPMVVQAGIGSELPWWPTPFIVIGGLLLIAALGWQFAQAIKERRSLSKTFSRTRTLKATDITWH